MIYSHAFRGRGYFSSAVGVSNPRWALESFTSEAGLREEWWGVKEGDVVLDVGAGFGSYTLTALAAGASLVIAAEPHKETFFTLCGNVAVNAFPPGRFVPLTCVLCDLNNVVTGYDSGNNSSLPGPASCEQRLAKTVDALVTDLQLTRLDWLKVDVEGAEGMVLAGAAMTLATYRPRVLVEVHNGMVHEVGKQVTERMAGAGYRLAGERRGDGVNDLWQLWEHPEGTVR